MFSNGATCLPINGCVGELALNHDLDGLWIICPTWCDMSTHRGEVVNDYICLLLKTETGNRGNDRYQGVFNQFIWLNNFTESRWFPIRSDNDFLAHDVNILHIDQNIKWNLINITVYVVSY